MQWLSRTDSETYFVRSERRGQGCKKCTQSKTTVMVYMVQRMQKQEQNQWDHQPEAGFWSRSPFQKISITSSVYAVSLFLVVGWLNYSWFTWGRWWWWHRKWRHSGRGSKQTGNKSLTLGIQSVRWKCSWYLLEKWSPPTNFSSWQYWRSCSCLSILYAMLYYTVSECTILKSLPTS